MLTLGGFCHGFLGSMVWAREVRFAVPSSKNATCLNERNCCFGGGKKLALFPVIVASVGRPIPTRSNVDEAVIYKVLETSS